MTVKELIEMLSVFDGDAKVFTELIYSNHKLGGVFEVGYMDELNGEKNIFLIIDPDIVPGFTMDMVGPVAES